MNDDELQENNENADVQPEPDVTREDLGDQPDVEPMPEPDEDEEPDDQGLPRNDEEKLDPDEPDS